jgi:hypothetical protein
MFQGGSTVMVRSQHLLLVIGFMLQAGLVMPVLAADTPVAKTYQPGYWQPVARVNPQQPVNVLIVNQTGLELEYGLTEDRPIQTIPVNETIRLNSKPLPMHLPINLTSSGGRDALKYEVATEGNTVTVLIKRLENTIDGDRTLSINKTGAIYLQ